MIAQKVEEINTKVLEQISFLQIPQSIPPTEQELENLWKTEIKGLVNFVRDMDNVARMTDDDFVVRDDSFDLQICHIEDEWKPHRDIFFEASSFTSYDANLIMVAVTNKDNAKYLCLKAFEDIGKISILSVNTNSKEVIEKYWIGKYKDWGQNPDYTAFAIKYQIKVPYLKIDYSQVN